MLLARHSQLLWRKNRATTRSITPCSIAGNLLSNWINPDIGLTHHTKIDIGTIDHFAGMIGTGNIKEGVISESAGTVLSIATLVTRIPVNCGPFPGTCPITGMQERWIQFGVV